MPEIRGPSVATFAPPELHSLPSMSAASNASAAGALDEAYRRGFADGASTLDAESEQQRDDAMEALGAALKGLSNVATEVRARLSANLSALALAVARQLLEREVEVDPTVVRGLVQKALAATPLAGVVTVRLHPADLSALGDPTAFRPPSGAPFELKWVADPTLMRGGCVVETPAAVVDGRVDHALLELYERLSRE